MHAGALTLSLSLVAKLWKMAYSSLVYKWVSTERLSFMGLSTDSESNIENTRISFV